MTKVHPAYLARELARWTRPNAHHFVRPDWRRYVKKSTELAAYFESIERKYRPDQARVPAGDPGGGQWTEEEGSGEGTARPTSAGDSAGSERVDPAQFRSEQRTPRSDQLIQAGGQDLGSFGNGVSIAKGPGIAHEEHFDPTTGVTTLSFEGIGVVVVDERSGDEVTGTVYHVGAQARPDMGLNITIDRSGKVLAYPTVKS